MPQSSKIAPLVLRVTNTCWPFVAGPHLASKTPLFGSPTVHSSKIVGSTPPNVGFRTSSPLLSSPGPAPSAATRTTKSEALPELEKRTVPIIRDASRSTLSHCGLGSFAASAVFMQVLSSASTAYETGGSSNLKKVDCLALHVELLEAPHACTRSQTAESGSGCDMPPEQIRDGGHLVPASPSATEEAFGANPAGQ
eukprot:2161867-Rhodomonas_salina.1